MPSTEEQVKSIILKHNGVRKQQIARELKMGLDYVGLICRELERKGEITFKAQDRTKPAEESVLLGIPKMTEKLMHILERAGYKTIESLADAPIARLMQETNLELREAAGLINQARKPLNKI